MMQITLNGESREIGEGLTIEALIVELGVDPTLVAVEKNSEIVPKTNHVDTPVADGDVIELVRFIGGG